MDGRWAPITDAAGFIDLPAAELAGWYQRWRPQDADYVVYRVGDDLNAIFESLLPLNTHRSRILVVGTHSKWTACFDNSLDGSDTNWVRVAARANDCSCVKFAYVDPLHRDDTGRYGIVEFSTAIPLARDVIFDEIEGIEDGYSIRIVSLSDDGGRVAFRQFGKAFNFEEISSYSKKRKRDRFTFPMLDNYLTEFGIRAFDDTFYKADDAFVIERVAPRWPSEREKSLEEARAGWASNG